MKGVRAVTFDCWGTLLTDHEVTRAAVRGEIGSSPAAQVRVQALVEHAGLEPDDATELITEAWRTHHRAWVSGRQYGSDGMARFCAERLGLDGAAAALCSSFEEAAMEGDVEALPGAVQTLSALREHGLPTALVCDTGFTPGRVVRRFLADAGLLELLDVCVFSNEVGVPKPHAKMFRTATEGIGVEAQEAVHVGDLRRTDIAGGRSFGMRTVRITQVHDDDPDPPLPDADAVVGSHAELLELLLGRPGT